MRSVERTIKILEILAGADNGVRLTDICCHTGLDGSTALRFLNAMEKLGYAAREVGGNRYYLGLRACYLAGGPAFTVLQRVARVHMEALQRACGEDVNLATMDAGAAICLETQKSSHILGVNFSSGLRVPVHASSIGKAMLAFLPLQKREALLSGGDLERYTPNTITCRADLEHELEMVRRCGYATDREEFTSGVVCIGTPLFDVNGHVVAALSITAPVQRISLPDLEARYADLLLCTGRAISRDLGCKELPFALRPNAVGPG
ncbi:MAG: IclR family transcriptional regulator [Firmicutes bacterium]|nr:IclR family transcriptional regulator [Bacillota bacterium]